VREERRFFKMVNHEELKATQEIAGGRDVAPPTRDITSR